MSLRHFNIPVFVPHFGCPHDCIFCNQKNITGMDEGVSPDDVKNIIETYLETIPKEEKPQLAFFGGSFTGIDMVYQIKLLSVVAPYIKDGLIEGIRISTRPDYINRDILQMLKEYNVIAIELGVQSTDDEVLRANNRGHDFLSVKLACELIREYDFELGLQMMSGMYLSNDEKDIKTAIDIANLLPDTVRIYPTIVLKETHLASLFNSGQYLPPTLEESVSLCAKITRIFNEKNIRIIRMGLQSTDNINENGDIVAGAYHSSFGELVVSRIMRERIEELIKDIKQDSITVLVNSKDVSKATGNKRENLIYFKNKYNKNIKITASDDI